MSEAELPAEFRSLEQPGGTKTRVRHPDVPGKREPVGRRLEEAKQAAAPEMWDDKPSYYVVRGEEREFFTISNLAQALGYSVQSIRAWEAAGLLPKSPYRSARTRGPVAGGKSNKGRRLWTRAQIEAVLAAARNNQCILNREPPNAEFYAEVKAAFDAISADDR